MEPKIEVKRYKTRYWAVWKSDELIAVTLYKKGAEKVAWLLSNSPNKVSVEKQSIEEAEKPRRSGVIRIRQLGEVAHFPRR